MSTGREAREERSSGAETQGCAAQHPGGHGQGPAGRHQDIGLKPKEASKGAPKGKASRAWEAPRLEVAVGCDTCVYIYICSAYHVVCVNGYMYMYYNKY